MKKILFACLFLIAATTGFAQKIGHINSNDLLQLMPERKTAETALQEYAKQLETQLQTMSAEYDNKVQEFQSKEIKDEVLKQDKIKEITNLEQRIKDFQTTAQESLQKKETELLTPMLDKAKKAIQDVAKEGGYKYILDTSSGLVLHFEESDNVLPLVKKKLGI